MRKKKRILTQSRLRWTRTIIFILLFSNFTGKWNAAERAFSFENYHNCTVYSRTICNRTVWTP